MKNRYNYVIIGAGVIGMAVARAIKNIVLNAEILVIDKEAREATHASSRNSGVLHAGFYYTADSMKARFTVDGNRAMKEFCFSNNLPVNECGKLVVAQDEDQLKTLYELKERGEKNGSTVSIIDEKEAKRLEPNVKTYKKALHSPDTASIDPTRVCAALKGKLKGAGVDFSFETAYIRKTEEGIATTKGDIKAERIVNCAGLYADQVAHDFGFGQQFTMIPFKGLYLKYTKNTTDLRMNIYPVPDLKNPFLGVHFTKTVDGTIKIGPTATPAYWRENYDRSNMNVKEMAAILGHEFQLILFNHFGFRDLAIQEMKKRNKKHFIKMASRLVESIDPNGFTEWTRPGIRAQLLDRKLNRLVQDFVVEGDDHSTHILNAVSPAFTCAFPFADYVTHTFIIRS